MMPTDFNIKKKINNFIQNVTFPLIKQNITLHNFEQSPPKSILFLCQGNVCRSPFAEHIANKIKYKSVNESIEINSAGIDVTLSNPPPKNAIDSAFYFGVKLEDHRSKSLSIELLEGYDCIILMEVQQLYQLRHKFPKYSHKYTLLKLFKPIANRSIISIFDNNVKDPYGLGKENFLYCYSEISACIASMLSKLSKS